MFLYIYTICIEKFKLFRSLLHFYKAIIANLLTVITHYNVLNPINMIAYNLITKIAIKMKIINIYEHFIHNLH